MDQYPFDEKFEETLLARLIRDRKFHFANLPVMREEYFQNQVHRDVFGFSRKYYEKYSDTITIDILKNEVKKYFAYRRKRGDEETDKEKLNFYFNIVDNIFSIDLSTGESYTIDVIIDFARRQEMKKIIKDAADRITFGKDLSNLSSEINKIQTIGSTVDVGYDYFNETAGRSIRMYEKPEHVVSTGFNKLNKFLGGGLAGGELGLVVGPPSRGKTAALVNISVGALMNRKNVMYFVLEGSRDDVAVRFDMRLSRVSKDQLSKKSKDVYDFVMYFSKLSKAKLILQMFPTESASVKDLDDFLTHKEMTDGFIPDIIVIDYLNLCRRSNTKEDTWLGRNYREGKSLGVRRNKPIWSAVQAKMGSLKSDIITPKDIAEATGRIWADADIIIGLCQNEEEEKRIPKELRFFLGKNRNRAANRIVPVSFDANLMLMEEIAI